PAQHAESRNVRPGSLHGRPAELFSVCGLRLENRTLKFCKGERRVKRERLAKREMRDAKPWETSTNCGLAATPRFENSIISHLLAHLLSTNGKKLLRVPEFELIRTRERERKREKTMAKA